MNDHALIENLRALMPTPPKQGLPTVEPRGAQAGRRVSAPYVPPPQGGGGLVSPIVEETRTLHPPRVVFSSDGLIAFTLRSTDELRSRDAEGTLEVRRFADAP